MNDFLNRYGNWALVAGAAEGLGEAYCHVLAEKGINLIMLDKEKKSMDILANKLEKGKDIEIIRLEMDLKEEGASKAMIDASSKVDCRLLIYNAAFSQVKTFFDHNNEELDNYIDINCRTLIHTIHGFADYLSTKPSGGILMMSSLAGIWGTNLVAPYGASKAFTLNLAEALYHEFKEFNIDVMACIAGATATPAYLSTNPEYGFIKPHVMNPRAVAEYALGMLGKRPYCIPGTFNKMSYFLMTRILGRRFSGRLMNRTMKRMYGGKSESQG